LVDTVIPAAGELPPTDSELQSAINGIALKMVYIALGLGLAEGLKEAFLTIARHRFQAKLKGSFFEALCNQEMGYFDIKKTGNLLSHLSEDVAIVEEAWTSNLAKTFQFMSQFVVGVILSFRASWFQSLMMMCIIPFFSLVAVSGVFVAWSSKLTSNSAARALSTATEVVTGMKTVRSMSGEEKEAKRFNKSLSKVVLASLFKSLATGSAMFFGHLIIWCGVAFSFFIGGILITDGIGGHKITIGTMFQTFGVSLFAVIGLAQTAAEGAQLLKSLASANQLLKVVEREPQITPRGGTRIPPEELKGRIVFENVSFAYPSRPDVVVLENFSLTIEPGQSVALVGESGSGKSTITNLLEKFYLPLTGRITVDGYNLYDIDPKWWRRTIGIVTQEPVLFGMSIEDNIKYASLHGLITDPNISHEEVEESAKKANAHDFIMDLRDKYETLVGERGVGLSGGQKQRVAIARVCLTDPTILLLDEATSALDNESESLVQDALNKLMKGRTTVSIAHRLSTIVDSDKIVVMSKGKIVEMGNHQELLQLGGYYRVLAEKQTMGRSGSSAESLDMIGEVDDE